MGKVGETETSQSSRVLEKAGAPITFWPTDIMSTNMRNVQWEAVCDPSPTENAILYFPSQDPDVGRRNATGDADTHLSLSGAHTVNHQPRAKG